MDACLSKHAIKALETSFKKGAIIKEGSLVSATPTAFGKQTENRDFTDTEINPQAAHQNSF